MTNGEVFGVYRVGPAVASQDIGLFLLGGKSTYYVKDGGSLLDGFGAVQQAQSVIVSATPSLITNIHLLRSYCSTTNRGAEVNNAVVTQITNSQPGNFPQSPCLGFDGSRSLFGDCLEFIVFETILQNEQRESLKTYCRYRYDLNSW